MKLIGIKCNHVIGIGKDLHIYKYIYYPEVHNILHEWSSLHSFISVLKDKGMQQFNQGSHTSH
jgi:hypothetical protein